MATSWATKRQFVYGGSFLLVIGLIFSFVFFKVVYKVPVCTDGVKNGDETGVDCGGSCKNLCTNDTLAPIVLWSKAFNVSGSLYSAVAYVENPNITSRNPKAEYEFKIYDSKNILIDSRKGSVSIPTHKRFAIFEPGFDLKTKIPKYVQFEFTSFAPWTKDTAKEPDITVSYSSLLSTSTSPRIEGSVSNNSQQSLPTVELTGFVVDGNDNVVAASRTFVDNLLKRTSQDFVFTWPKPFDLGVETCSSDLDVATVLDRSGSMRSESVNPPEPFNTVKSTAEEFLNNLPDGSQVSVFSFGTHGSQESSLSGDKDASIKAVESISLGTSTSQQTNITEGLQLAQAELNSGNAKPGSKKVLILLTDGIPTEPQKAGEPDYPRISAETTSRAITASGTLIYTIGLGKGVNEGFLKNIAGDSSHYFFAPTKDTLAGIYDKIGTSLCERRPNLIIVNYRLP